MGYIAGEEGEDEDGGPRKMAARVRYGGGCGGGRDGGGRTGARAGGPAAGGASESSGSKEGADDTPK